MLSGNGMAIEKYIFPKGIRVQKHSWAFHHPLQFHLEQEGSNNSF